MFRELYDRNGMLGHLTRTITKKSGKEITYANSIVIDGIEYSNNFEYNDWIDSEEENIEYICFRYCIENGVKLAWLKQAHIDSCDESETQSFHIDRGSYIFTNQYSKSTKHIYDLFMCDDKIEIIKPINLCGTLNREWALFGDDNFCKLIAAIFAHDIKII